MGQECQAGTGWAEETSRALEPTAKTGGQSKRGGLCSERR